MDSDEVLASEILGHGAYLCLRRSSGGDAGKAAAAPIDALAHGSGCATNSTRARLRPSSPSPSCAGRERPRPT